MLRSEMAVDIERPTSTQQSDVVRRLKSTMQRHRELAGAVLRPLVLSVLAMLLILVALPAALAAQAAATR